MYKEDEQRGEPFSIYPIIKDISIQQHSKGTRGISLRENPKLSISVDDFLTLWLQAYKTYGFTSRAKIKWFLYGIGKTFENRYNGGEGMMISEGQLSFLCKLAGVRRDLIIYKKTGE